jgi:ribonuclease HII
MSADMMIAVDEVGRGCLAGPVVVAGVLAPRDFSHPHLRDSKKLSASKRYAILPELQSLNWVVAVLEAQVIDNINILNATKAGMQYVISDLKSYGDWPVYVDGNQLPFQDGNISAIIGGDDLIPSISAASVIAKCFRDDLMRNYSSSYPQYNWDRNAGYGTKSHRDAIIMHGITPLHRLSFLKMLYIDNPL